MSNPTDEAVYALAAVYYEGRYSPHKWANAGNIARQEANAVAHNILTSPVLSDLLSQAEARGAERAQPLIIAAGEHLDASRQRANKLAEALKKIASCEERFPGDVVSIARAALTEYQQEREAKVDG